MLSTFNDDLPKIEKKVNKSNKYSLEVNINKPLSINVRQSLHTFAIATSSDQLSGCGSSNLLLNGTLNVGIFFMPKIFDYSGLLCGLFLIIKNGCLSVNSAKILMDSSHELSKRIKKNHLDYSDSVEVAFLFGPNKFKKLSRIAKRFTSLMLCLSHLGILIIYTIIISNFFKEVVDLYKENFIVHSYRFIYWFLVFFIPLCQLQKLKYFFVFSFLSNFFIILTLITTLYYIFIHETSLQNFHLMSTSMNVFKTPALVAIATITTGNILPIDNRIKTLEVSRKLKNIFYSINVFTLALHVFVGVSGYLKFGNYAFLNIIENIPKQEVSGQLARISLCLSLCFSYAFQFFIPFREIWKTTNDVYPIGWQDLYRISLNAFIVLFITAIATLLKQYLEIVIIVVGGIFLCIVGLMIPNIVEILTMWEMEDGLSWKQWIKNIYTICISFVILLSAIISTVIKEEVAVH